MKASEEKYWMENYPKEAETIITLCELFDELGNDDASKAQLDYVIGLLRRKEEGRLIELPVPIGSELWAITVDTNEINHDTLTYDVLGDFFDELDKHPEYNDRIFATREEAEAKLKEWKEKTNE